MTSREGGTREADGDAELRVELAGIEAQAPPRLRDLGADPFSRAGMDPFSRALKLNRSKAVYLLLGESQNPAGDPGAPGGSRSYRAFSAAVFRPVTLARAPNGSGSG